MGWEPAYTSIVSDKGDGIYAFVILESQPVLSPAVRDELNRISTFTIYCPQGSSAAAVNVFIEMS
ncbi:hypothetical protein [Kordiimonas aestuarii]|uniref:hypothetical protein n=1 Tax=Kordiimonas aestuarii TaxID=1005925 RepID=UPI0021D16C1A|nr:hypothetical protein [Kordiimonas aestuarii]